MQFFAKRLLTKFYKYVYMLLANEFLYMNYTRSRHNTKTYNTNPF